MRLRVRKTDDGTEIEFIMPDGTVISLTDLVNGAEVIDETTPEPGPEPQPKPPAEFVGFGRDTIGGKGGRIVKVTNLDDSGPGSLRAAAEAEGTRTILFDVGGVLDLKSQIEIKSGCTIAGQTAPGAGIVVKGARLRIVEGETVVTGMQCLPGDGGGDKPANRDGISVGDGDKVIRNVVIDRNTFGWSVDEAASFWGNVRDATFSNNIVAEALDRSIHPEGRHSMGVLFGGADGASPDRVTAVMNLLAHNNHRNAQIKDESDRIEWLANLIFNHGDNGLRVKSSGRVHAIGSRYIRGVNSPNGKGSIVVETDRLYEADNDATIEYRSGATGSPSPLFEPSMDWKLPPTSDLEVLIAARAGSSRKQGSEFNRRVVQMVLERSGKIINSPGDVGGYPSFEARTEHPTSIDDVEGYLASFW